MSERTVTSRTAAQPAGLRAAIAVPALVAAEFLGTTLWFSASAVAPQIVQSLDLPGNAPLDLSSPVQLGFVAGTLLLGFSGIGDRFRASRIFLFAALMGAVANALVCTASAHYWLLLLLRMLTGLALAGIYPVGMKLVISWNMGAARTTLGWLVGMLTLGTAFPHLVNHWGLGFDWRLVILTSSALACCAGLIVTAIGDGPWLPPARAARDHVASVIGDFCGYGLRRAAIAYLGHMWELYAFWALVPLLVAYARDSGPSGAALDAFSIIAIGTAGCVLGGYASGKIGSRRVAAISMVVSAAMCLCFPIVDRKMLLVLLHVWGFFVIADSPQLSTLASEAAASRRIGSTLALLNGGGFLLTAVSIHLVTALWNELGPATTWLLLPGPCIGAAALLFTRAAPSSSHRSGGGVSNR